MPDHRCQAQELPESAAAVVLELCDAAGAAARCDHAMVAELTDDDVREMKQFLAGTCTDLKRWLPEPQWQPGWQSEAAIEAANQEVGASGPWGPDPVRSVYVAAALFLEGVLQCMRALADCITTDTTHYVPNCLARAAMESGSQAFWLLEEGIGARRRVARFMLLRASGAQRLADEISRTDLSSPGLYGETQQQAKALAGSLGLRCNFKPKGKYRGEWSCEKDTLPGYTARNLMLETAMNTAAAYSIYSSALHADWHSMVGNWSQGTLPDGSKAIVIRPDRVAVWAAVHGTTAPAIPPAVRALTLLGHKARLREVHEWTGNTLDQMRRMDLPRDWWWTGSAR